MRTPPIRTADINPLTWRELRCDRCGCELRGYFPKYAADNRTVLRLCVDCVEKEED